MPSNVALTGLAKDMAARAETGKPVRIGLVGAGEMGTDIVSQVARMRGIEIGVISELKPAPRRNRLNWPMAAPTGFRKSPAPMVRMQQWKLAESP